MTPDGIMHPTRTTKGGCNTADNFQACVEPCFSELRDHLLAWLDDFALYAVSESDLLGILDRFLALCAKYNLVIWLPKSTFYAKQIRWVGRLIDANGVTLDPANYSGVRDAAEPTSAAELYQYIHCMQWMSSEIPRFAERAPALYDLLEKAYAKAGRQTKKIIAKYDLKGLGWGSQHCPATARSCKTAHRDPSLHLCVHSDASDEYWAASVTQCGKA